MGRERGWERGEGKRWGEEDGKWVRGEQRMGREDALALIHRYTTHVIYAYIMIYPYIKLHIYHCIYIYIYNITSNMYNILHDKCTYCISCD